MGTRACGWRERVANGFFAGLISTVGLGGPVKGVNKRASGIAWHPDEPCTQVVTEVPCFESKLIVQSGQVHGQAYGWIAWGRQDLNLKIRRAPVLFFKHVGGNASWLG
jgi:hypothetical protein